MKVGGAAASDPSWAHFTHVDAGVQQGRQKQQHKIGRKRERVGGSKREQKRERERERDSKHKHSPNSNTNHRRSSSHALILVVLVKGQ